jgi:hypothetical protein
MLATLGKIRNKNIAKLSIYSVSAVLDGHTEKKLTHLSVMGMADSRILHVIIGQTNKEMLDWRFSRR